MPRGYKCSTVFRHKTTGGGCAVVYNDTRVQVSTIEYINVPDGVRGNLLTFLKRNKLEILFNVKNPFKLFQNY